MRLGQYFIQESLYLSNTAALAQSMDSKACRLLSWRSHSVQVRNRIRASFTCPKFNTFEAFKEQSKKHPNYGKETGLNATQWWANVRTSLSLQHQRTHNGA
jgi:hypothetical protein